jgi:hypothetical protein
MVVFVDRPMGYHGQANEPIEREKHSLEPWVDPLKGEMNCCFWGYGLAGSNFVGLTCYMLWLVKLTRLPLRRREKIEP